MTDGLHGVDPTHCDKCRKTSQLATCAAKLKGWQRASRQMFIALHLAVVGTLIGALVWNRALVATTAIIHIACLAGGLASAWRVTTWTRRGEKLFAECAADLQADLAEATKGQPP